MAEIHDREREAQAEMAATRVGPWAARTLVAALLALTLVGPALEFVRWRQGKSAVRTAAAAIPTPGSLWDGYRAAGALAANNWLRTTLFSFEDSMGRDSALSALLRPQAQWLLLRRFDYGNSQVLRGRQGELFFSTSYKHLVGLPFLDPEALERRRRAAGPQARLQPDPRPGLIRLRNQLARRHVALVFFPVPVKEQIHPENLLRGAGLGAGELENPSTRELFAALESAGVATFDPTAELRAAALAGDRVYSATDTHWNALGMRIAARALARELRARHLVSDLPPAGLERHPFEYSFAGDLAGLLGLGELAERIPQEKVELDAVRTRGGGNLSELSAASEVLLLGDSYSVAFAFNREAGAAGFGDQLAFELDRPVRTLARTAANDLPGRIQWLRDDPALLDGVRVVIYEVTARALSSTDWSSLSLRGRN